MTDTQFGGYELIDKIDQGGMAEIYRARRTGPHGFEKIVAIKRILPHLSRDRDFVAMFSSEARVAAQLQHPNIVEIYDYGRVDDLYYIAMEYVHGLNLNDLLLLLSDLNHPLHLDHCVYIIKKLCAALQYAHFLTDFRGRPLEIVHRDVNPKNVMISFNGAVKLMDFGIALAQSRCYQTLADGMIKGKIAYLSPEQVKSESLDHRSDLFSLGIVFYELITGIRPFQSDTEFGILRKIEKEDPIPPKTLLPSLPDAINDVILKCLEKDRNKRYFRASDIAADLSKYETESGFHCTQADFARFLADTLGEEVVESPVVPAKYQKDISSEITLDDLPSTATLKDMKPPVIRPVQIGDMVPDERLEPDPAETVSEPTAPTLILDETGDISAEETVEDPAPITAEQKQTTANAEPVVKPVKAPFASPDYSRAADAEPAAIAPDARTPAASEQRSDRAAEDVVPAPSEVPPEPDIPPEKTKAVSQPEEPSLPDLLADEWETKPGVLERHRFLFIFFFILAVVITAAFLVLGRQGVNRLLGLGATDFQGRLIISVTPSGADVEVDFIRQEKRPVDIPVTWPFNSQHTISVTHPAHRSVTLQIQVSETGEILFPQPDRPEVKHRLENDVIDLTIKLVPIYIDVEIRSKPKGAAVFVNGIDTGKKTPMTFSFSTEETSTIKLVKKGYDPFETTFDPASVTGKKPEPLEFTLKRHRKPTPAPVAKGRVVVHAPYPVDIYLGKRRLAKAVTRKTLRFSPGKVKLRLVNSEFCLNRTETVRIRSGKTSVINLDPPGSLLVKADPPGCAVKIGDHTLGTAPGRFQLAPGLYNVEFIWESCNDRKSVWVKIVSDQNKTIPKVVGCR